MVGMVNSVIRKLVKSVVTLINIRVISMDIVETMERVINPQARSMGNADVTLDGTEETVALKDHTCKVRAVVQVGM